MNKQNKNIMTQEDKELLFKDLCARWSRPPHTEEALDYLIKNHFDYRDLIQLDLAIAVTKENNPYKE